MLRKFTQTFIIPGTLAANHTFQWKVPSGCQLVHASLCNTSANAGSAKVGTTTDDDAYLAAEDFGISSAPAEVAAMAGFDGATAAGQWPAIPDGTIMQLTVTDHASHMANVCVVLTFVEGGV